MKKHKYSNEKWRGKIQAVLIMQQTSAGPSIKNLFLKLNVLFAMCVVKC